MGVCNCSMFCCTLLCVLGSSIAIILMGKRELFALLNLSSWCLVMIERLFLAVPQGCLQFVIVVFPDHTHLLFLLCLTHLCRMDFPISTNWMKLFPVLGLLGGIFHFYSNFKRNFCLQTVENLVLHCLPFPTKRTIGLYGLIVFLL